MPRPPAKPPGKPAADRITGPGAKRVRRPMPAADRRQAILDAALDVFSDKGFALARLDDVAVRAGIAKGTIYLHFADKEDLFRTLVTVAAGPVLDRIEQIAAQDLPVAPLLDALFRMFRSEVLGTRRKDIMRLVLTEGGRFPEIAALYHREVISRGLPALRKLLARAAERGELASDAPARFPHLVMAPLLVSLVWDRLFSPFEPLDVGALLEAHRSLLLARPDGASP
jgi:AcrR family transcriptional regulator